MYLLVTELTRDRMRQTQRDAEQARVARSRHQQHKDDRRHKRDRQR